MEAPKFVYDEVLIYFLKFSVINNLELIIRNMNREVEESFVVSTLTNYFKILFETQIPSKEV